MPLTIAGSDVDWISSLTDAGVKADVSSMAAGGVLTYVDFVKILTDIASRGAVTAAEFSDLKTIAANLNVGMAVSDYLACEFIQLVDGNPANASWNGGSTNATALGDLQVGTNCLDSVLWRDGSRS